MAKAAMIRPANVGKAASFVNGTLVRHAGESRLRGLGDPDAQIAFGCFGLCGTAIVGAWTSRRVTYARRISCMCTAVRFIVLCAVLAPTVTGASAAAPPIQR